MESPLTHHKAQQTPESVGHMTVVQNKLASPAAANTQRRKSSLTITVDGADKLLEAAVGAVHELVFRRKATNRCEQLRGKKVLFVCCGHDGLDSKKFTFELAHGLGVRCFLVEDGRNTLGDSLERNKIIEHFIRVDLTPRATLVENVMEALRPIADQIGGFDGVCTFWDDAVGLSARISEKFKLPGSPVHAVDIAHDKHLTREAMRAAKLPTPASYLVKNEADIQIAASKVGVPAILKPVYGASSLAVVKVEKLDKLLDTYHRVIHMLKEFYEKGELMGLRFNEDELASTFEQSSCSWLVMEEFLDGNEVDVDLLLKDGKLLYHCVVDDWPQIQPWFAEMGNNCPSILSPFEQQQLISMAVDTATKAMGFRDGVLHCELKHTSKGPRLIEVNPRMGGGPVWSLHKRAYGVDFVEEALYLCLGIKGGPYIPKTPQQCVSCGEKFFEKSMIVPKEFCKVIEAMRLLPNVVEASPLVEPGEKIIGIKDGFPTRTARFVVCAGTPMEAESYAHKLLSMCDIPQVLKAQEIGVSPNALAPTIRRSDQWRNGSF